MNRLFIAEKPELARAIAEGLGGKSTRRDGFIEVGADLVTWCFGHMLALQDLGDYDPRYRRWDLADLPIVPIPWRKKPGADKSAQLKIITALIKRAGIRIIVHAGDPDDEGQLLVDEILEYAGWRGPVQRLLINDLTPALVRRSLANLRDNAEFRGLSQAAEARQVGDQLFGYNLTRLYTLTAQATGGRGVLSAGRVQTPILGLVVRRDREHEGHKKTFYYSVGGRFRFDGVECEAGYQPIEGDPVDERGRLRLLDEQRAQAIADAIRQNPCRILSASTKQREQHPPLPYNLLALQRDASRKFNLRPDEVREITQALREKYRVITYNRSDCEYLSDEQHADAPAVLAAIGKTAPLLANAASKARPEIKGRCFNSSKVSAHHAIIPTQSGADLGRLADGEQKIYLLIARAYVAQFYPLYQYDQTEIQVECAGHRFTATARVTVAEGWRVLYRNDRDNEDLDYNQERDLDLRLLTSGDEGICLDGTADKKETKPRPHYSMASLLSDLTRVAQYVQDPDLRAALILKDRDKAGEHGGIGTPATRDAIIATLFKRGWIEERGKTIVSTPAGRAVYDSLPDSVRFPDQTALWHQQQEKIRAGELTAEGFVRGLADWIGEEVARVRREGMRF